MSEQGGGKAALEGNSADKATQIPRQPDQLKNWAYAKAIDYVITHWHSLLIGLVGGLALPVVCMQFWPSSRALFQGIAHAAGEVNIPKNPKEYIVEGTFTFAPNEQKPVDVRCKDGDEPRSSFFGAYPGDQIAPYQKGSEPLLDQGRVVGYRLTFWNGAGSQRPPGRLMVKLVCVPR